MKVDIEQPAAWSRRLTITVPAERVDQERRQVASSIAKRVRLPGFRKGKVPASVIQKQYGPSIEQETIERVVNTAYREALQQEGFSPISEASVDSVDYETGSELSFKVEFEVRPDISLDRLGGFTVKQPSTTVGDEEVDRVVNRLREDNADWQPLESGKPAEGDRAKVAITPLEEGGERPEPSEYDVVLGAGEILDDIDAAIRTLEIGGEDEFSVSLPAPEDQEGEAVEDHRIHLRLISAERPDLPEADDEFAGKLGDFESMDALRTRIREDLESESQREADREVRRLLMGEVIDANAFEVPPSLVDQYLDGLLQAPEDADPQELEAARKQAKPAAEYGVRRMLVIERVAELENLHATQEDVEARVQEIAESNDMDANDVRAQLMRSGRLQALASDLTETRVFEYLKSLSTIETEDA